jgi:pimeloyl-ACP methyl ester carboxylesterase
LDAAGSVGSIAAPLLLVYGGSDAVVPPQQAHQMAHQAPPETTLLMVPRATHLSLSIDRRVVRQIAVWLQNAASKHARQ